MKNDNESRMQIYINDKLVHESDIENGEIELTIENFELIQVDETTSTVL